jgi:glucosamine--fructose-6-phosphate aminotransferase (isomerizing)
LYPKINDAKTSRTLLVAISRSAETTETVQAVKQFKQAKRGSVIVISNNAQRPLSILGDLNLIMPDGQEKGIAQTRSFASMYIAAVALTAVLANRSDLLEKMEQLPAIGQRLLTQYEDLAHTWGANLELERIYFLGSGERYGLACEANLKMKEMTLTDSEPFHFLEFRHGPISMVGANALVIGLVSEKNRALETAVLYDAARLGSQTLWLGEQQCDINFNAALPETIQNVLYLPILQLIAYYRAIAKNLNPDQPHNLDMVVKLDWLQTEPPPAVAGLKTEPP